MGPDVAQLLHEEYDFFLALLHKGGYTIDGIVCTGGCPPCSKLNVRCISYEGTYGYYNGT